MGSRKKTEECPLCGEMFSPQGLDGHLRMAHQADPGKVKNMMNGADGEGLTEEPEADQVLYCIRQMKKCRRTMEELDELDRSNLLRRDKSVREAKDTLAELERKYRDRLEALRDGVKQGDLLDDLDEPEDVEVPA